jgi:methylenetetrahydrofolate dehydrogenase (NADP+)/methenyltetrahydrofolate cyclohydrolase
MRLISGKPIAEQALARVRTAIRERGIRPGLAVVMVGTDPASEIYVGLKERAAESVGVAFEKHALPETSRTEDIQEIVRALNERPDIHGIIVQLPLPVGIDTDAVIAAIHPEKDADGFHPETVARFLSGQSSVPPVFPRAILALIESTGVPLDGKRALVFANSVLFARVISATLGRADIEAEDSLTLGTDAALERTAQSDIIITATGNPHFLQGRMVRPGAIVIDGGITRVGEQVMSDADPASFAHTDCFLTPVPGGVGPVTVAFLVSRVAELALGGENGESILEA